MGKNKDKKRQKREQKKRCHKAETRHDSVQQTMKFIDSLPVSNPFKQLAAILKLVEQRLRAPAIHCVEETRWVGLIRWTQLDEPCVIHLKDSKVVVKTYTTFFTVLPGRGFAILVKLNTAEQDYPFTEVCPFRARFDIDKDVGHTADPDTNAWLVRDARFETTFDQALDGLTLQASVEYAQSNDDAPLRRMANKLVVLHEHAFGRPLPEKSSQEVFADLKVSMAQSNLEIVLGNPPRKATLLAAPLKGEVTEATHFRLEKQLPHPVGGDVTHATQLHIKADGRRYIAFLLNEPQGRFGQLELGVSAPKPITAFVGWVPTDKGCVAGWREAGVEIVILRGVEAFDARSVTN